MSHRRDGKDINDLAPCVMARGQRCLWLVCKDVAIINRDAIDKEKAADQGKLPRIVVGHDGHAPAAIRQRRGVHLRQPLLVQLIRQHGVASDLLGAKGSDIGGVHPRHMILDLWRRWRWLYLVPA